MPKAQAPRKAKAEAKAAPAKKAKKGESILYSTLLSSWLNANITHLDPNAPKRGLSAYMIFANEQRGKLKEEQPDLKFGTSILLSSHHYNHTNINQARSARFLEPSGRSSLSLKRLLTTRRLRLTRSVTRPRRSPTRYVIVLLHLTRIHR